MSICDWYPNPHEFMNCERNTLEFLKDKPFVAKNFTDLVQNAHNCYFRSKNSLNLFFESEININLSKKEKKKHPGIAIISASIETTEEKSFKTVSYNLTIIDNAQEQEKRILRKFHFDFAPPDTTKKSHPVFHLQYGGNLSKKLESMGLQYFDFDMDIDIDKPRLCYFPLSLALLINVVLKEFPGEATLKLIERNEWRDLIRRNEKIVLAPFFEKCYRFFLSRPENTLFLSDFYYGN
jgi:hypothetical protein